jgi:hypothetical protein
MQPLVSSLSAEREREVLEAAYIYNYDVDLLKISTAMLETCRGF